jgi:hypothetical protein
VAGVIPAIGKDDSRFTASAGNAIGRYSDGFFPDGLAGSRLREVCVLGAPLARLPDSHAQHFLDRRTNLEGVNHVSHKFITEQTTYSGIGARVRRIQRRIG